MKRVIDVDLISRLINNYDYPRATNLKDDNQVIQDMELAHLCVELRNMLELCSMPVETFTTAYQVDNMFTGRLPIEEQEKFKEYAKKGLYDKMGMHLYEHGCGEFHVFDTDRMTEQFRETLTLTVISEPNTSIYKR